jgi:hypothetical protein
MGENVMNRATEIAVLEEVQSSVFQWLESMNIPTDKYSWDADSYKITAFDMKNLIDDLQDKLRFLTNEPS